jgi:proteasome lid subunit RPN8/RPN11
MLGLEIPKNTLDAMIEHAKAEAPFEACGILAGEGQRVQRWYKMTNRDHSGEHFMMEPAEQFKVAKELRADGLEMVAVYHSHPQTPAIPSEEDVRLALTPNIVHVIVSLQYPNRPTVKAYEIDNGPVTEIDVRIVDVISLR